MLDELRHTVERMLDDGASLERIEAEVVDRAPVDEDRRSALWLYAWSRGQGLGGRPVLSPPQA